MKIGNSMHRKFKDMIFDELKRRLPAILTVISLILIAMVMIVLVAIVTVCVQTICSDGWRLALNIDGVKNMQSFWGEYSQMITFGGCCLTLFVANYHLTKYLDVETIKALGKLREMLNTPEKKAIHNYLLPQEDRKFDSKAADGSANPKQEAVGKSRPASSAPAKDSQAQQAAEWSTVDLYDYLGTIELGAIMLKRGVITRDEFYNQFGYRVENLLSDKEIIDHVEESKRYYDMFLFAKEEVEKYREKKKKE